MRAVEGLDIWAIEVNQQRYGKSMILVEHDLQWWTSESIAVGAETIEIYKRSMISNIDDAPIPLIV